MPVAAKGMFGVCTVILFTFYSPIFCTFLDKMITIIASTSRPNSATLKVAKYYQKRLLEKGAESSILSLTDLPPNIIQTDLYGKRSEAFAHLLEQINPVHKFIFIIPEYNGSYPGVLKVFIDACDFPDSFYEKKTALVGISSGKYGNIRGIDHFTGVCHYLSLHVMPLKLHIANIKSELDVNNDLFKQDTVKFTDEQMDKFINF
jgi:chromate reductase, NAD(P)H dehydrogenase (quinone)